MNVIFNGKRTTARFPGCVFDLAMTATGLSDAELCAAIRAHLLTDDYGPTDTLTASNCALVFLLVEIKSELTHPSFKKRLCHGLSDSPDGISKI
jgi:hypothetical protein